MRDYINFANRAQKIIWDSELCGQFSDGKWENSSLNYKAWTGLETFIDPDNIGCTLPKWERRYGILGDDLWFIVGYRVIANVRIAKYFNVDTIPGCVQALAEQLIRTDPSDIENKDYRNSQVKTIEELTFDIERKFTQSSKDYIIERVIEAKSLGFDLNEIRNAIRQPDLYSKTQFNNDLREMKKIQSTFIQK